MFTLNPLGVDFADGMDFGVEMTTVRAPVIGIPLGDAKRCQSGFEFQESRIFVVRQHISQNFAGIMVNGMPEPTLLPSR